MHAADASRNTCWFGPAWLAQNVRVVAVHASTIGCSKAQVILTMGSTLEDTWEATGSDTCTQYMLAAAFESQHRSSNA